MNSLYRRAARRRASLPFSFVFGLLIWLGAAPARASSGDGDASGDPSGDGVGAALVTGQLAARHRDVVRAAVEEELRKARWTVRSLEGAAASRLAACFAAEHPWPCLLPAAAAHGVARLLAIRVDREAARGGHQLRLTGQLGALAARRITIDARYCGRCGDLQLAKAARQLAQRLLAGDAVRGDATRIELRTTPPDAVILLDGRMVEAPGGVIATSPGQHTVHLQRAGYRPELRQVHLARGERLVLEVALRATGEPWAPRAMSGASRLDRYPLSAANASESTTASSPAPSPAPPPASTSAPPSPPLTAGAAAPPAPAFPSAPPSERGDGEPGGEAPRQLRARRTAGAGSSTGKRRRLGWALAIGGGALLMAGGALLALDEDAAPDPTRRHHPRYLDSAPAGLVLAVSGGTFAIAGLAVILISPASSSRSSPPAPSARAVGLAVAAPF
jgi:PEGA domain